MTDEEKKSLLALMISDVPGNPYYPIFTDAQYGQFLKLAKGSLDKAVIPAAISASMIIGSDYTREVIGDLQLQRNAGANYLKALDSLIKNNSKSIPDGLMPWSASVNSPNKLLDFARCDCEDETLRRPQMAPEYEQWVRDLQEDVKVTDANVAINTTSISAIESDVNDVTAQTVSLTSRMTVAEADIDALQVDMDDVKTKLDTQVGINNGVQNSITSAINKAEVEDLYGINS